MPPSHPTTHCPFSRCCCYLLVGNCIACNALLLLGKRCIAHVLVYIMCKAPKLRLLHSHVCVCVWGCRKAKSLQLQLNLLLLLGRGARTPATRCCCCCMLLLQLSSITRRQDTKSFERGAELKRVEGQPSAIFRPTELRNPRKPFFLKK